MRSGVTGRQGLALGGLAFGLLLAALWAMGGLAVLERAAVETGRAVQEAMAGALRAVRAGHPGAVAGVLALCFGYGFVHAAGPGHGKFLIGSYGVARRVGFWPLAGLALASSLAQAAVAVLLVLVAFHLWGWTRAEVLGSAEGGIVTLSHALVLAVGLWLALRGGRALWAATAARPAPDHDHAHGPDCGCGHEHGPAPEAVERVANGRDALLLIAGVAARPCSGALMFLILTAQLGLTGLGIAGAMVMGLGVASVTVLVAGMAVWTREGAFAALPPGLAWIAPALETVAGLLIAVVAAGMLLG